MKLGSELTSGSIELGVVELLNQRVDHLDRPVHLEVSSKPHVSQTRGTTTRTRGFSSSQSTAWAEKQARNGTYPTKNFLAAIVSVSVLSVVIRREQRDIMQTRERKLWKCLCFSRKREESDVTFDGALVLCRTDRNLESTAFACGTLLSRAYLRINYTPKTPRLVRTADDRVMVME